jgi:hypothetical protein
MRLQTSLSVHRLDYEESKVLSVSLNCCAVRSHAQTDSVAGRHENAFSNGPITPHAHGFQRAGRVYGTENVALNSSITSGGLFSQSACRSGYKRTFSAPEYTSTRSSLPSCPGQLQVGSVGYVAQPTAMIFFPAGSGKTDSGVHAVATVPQDVAIV